MFSKKNCAVCAFCLHCRDTFEGIPSLRWDYQKDNLTKNEISQLLNEDISFLSEAQKKHDEWVALYEENEKERSRKKVEEKMALVNSPLGKFLGKDFCVLADIQPILPYSNPYPHREEFGMEACPIVPDHEYLMCWKEMWGKKDKDKWLELRHNKCKNFYPLSKKGTKTLNACDEERKEKADYRKFWRGVGVGFLSAVIVMLLRFLLAPYFSEKNTNSTIYFQNENLNKNEISSLEGKNITNKMQSAKEKRK